MQSKNKIKNVLLWAVFAANSLLTTSSLNLKDNLETKAVAYEYEDYDEPQDRDYRTKMAIDEVGRAMQKANYDKRTLYNIGEWVYWPQDEKLIKVLSVDYVTATERERIAALKAMGCENTRPEDVSYYSCEDYKKNPQKILGTNYLFLKLDVDVRTADQQNTRQFSFSNLRVRGFHGYGQQPESIYRPIETLENLTNPPNIPKIRLYELYGHEFNPDYAVNLSRYTPTKQRLVFSVFSMKGELIYLYDENYPEIRIELGRVPSQ